MLFGLISPVTVRGVRWPVRPPAQVTILFPSVVQVGNLDFARLSVDFIPIMDPTVGVGPVVSFLFIKVQCLAMPTALYRPVVTLLVELRALVMPMTIRGLRLSGNELGLWILMTRRWQCLRLTVGDSRLKFMILRFLLKKCRMYVVLTLFEVFATKICTSVFQVAVRCLRHLEFIPLCL